MAPSTRAQVPKHISVLWGGWEAGVFVRGILLFGGGVFLPTVVQWFDRFKKGHCGGLLKGGEKGLLSP